MHLDESLDYQNFFYIFNSSLNRSKQLNGCLGTFHTAKSKK